MVTYAFKSDYTPEIPDDESEKLSTTIKLSEVLAAGVRLEASAFSIEAHNAVTALTNSDLPLIPLYGKEGLCQEAHNAFRFKRIYVDAEHGIPFLSSSDIISLRPETDRYLSRKYTRNSAMLSVQKWDVLISRSGTIGNIALANEAFTGKAISEDVIRLSADNQDIAGFIAAFLRSRYGRPQLTQATYGSVIVHIEPEHLERVLIPDLPPIRRIEIGRLMCKAGELRDEANHLLDEADRLLHERLNLPYLKDIALRGSASFTTTIKASQLMGRLEASFHNPEAIAAEKQLAKLPVEITKIGDQRITKEVRAITKFRERTYVDKGGIPMLSSKQLFQVDPIDVKRLAKGSHTKDLPEIQLEENMIAVTRSGTIGKVQIIPKYMAAWTASEDATRILASDDINAGYLYAWLASDYGYCLMTRCSYGSVILEVDKEMFSSVHIPLPELSIRNEIGDLVLKANQLRDQAWRSEQEAISKLEKLISSKSNTPMNNQTPIESFSLANIKFDYNAEPIWELAARLSAKIPNEEWAKLPKDLAQNFDHYQQQQDS
ncbi:MAG: type I restriction endonuclease subunit R [Microcystis aeruginosa DA14]|uniref:Type I restriction endonuclease subunit R n=1 Tax=Microcystis aeruginosa DA14 TaxID=1987506 RepID=A0A3E0MM85_MICAE|nr:MAG: type I restriction endonuclease subunit R [Microcystis aeruginosa DA14]